MATTLRFILLGDDQASRAFDKFAKSVERSNQAVTRSNAQLKAQQKGLATAAMSFTRLAGEVTGTGSAFTVASSKASVMTRVLAGLNLATGLAEPLISSLVVSTVALSSALVAGGAGLAAYGVAFKPLATQIGTIMKLQQQAANGSKAAQKQLQQALKTTPPVVVRFAKSLKDAQTAYTSWADKLARPVLKPLQIALGAVNPLLKAISPLVKAAAGALTVVVGQLAAPIHNGGLERIVQTILPHVQPVIIGMAQAIGNIVVGIGGVLKAFLPFSDSMVFGLDKITRKFRDWGTTLSGHSGFHAIVAQWKQDWPVIKPVLENLLKIFKNVVADLASMATPSNSKALWQIANPLLALALRLSSHPALVTALAYLVLLSKGGGQLKTAFDGLKTGWGTLSNVVNKLTGGKIGTGMQSAGDTMLAASRNMQKAADTMAAASGGKAAAGGAAGEAAAGAAGGGGLRGILSKAGKLGLGALGEIGLPLFATSKIKLPGFDKNVLHSDIQSFQDNFTTPLKKAWNAVVPALGSAFTPGGALNKSLLHGWDHMVHGLTSAVGSAFSPGGALNKSMLRGGANMINSFNNGATHAWVTVRQWLNRTSDRVTTAVGNLGRTLWNNGLQSIRGLLNAGQFFWNGTARPWLSGVGGRIRNAVGNLTRTLFATGQNVVHGLLTGIRSFMAGIGSWVKGNIVDPLVNAVKHFFGINSPSTVMAGIGGHLVGGLIKGIVDANPVAVIKKVFGSMPAALGHLVEKGLIGFGSLGSRALKALGAVGGFFKNLFGGGGGGPPSANRTLAMKMFPWPASMFGAFDYLEMREAGYSLTARNPSSGAYGMAQFINGPSEYFQYGGNPSTASGQLIGMFNYIRQRYGNPVNAAAHERAFNWYAGGGPIDEPVIGLGMRSGRGYGFGEAGGEYVSSQASMRDVAALLASIHSELIRQGRTHAANPDRTGAAVSKALNSTTRAIAVRG